MPALSIITTHKMIPHATAHLKEDSSDYFLGTAMLSSRTEIKKTPATLSI